MTPFDSSLPTDGRQILFMTLMALLALSLLLLERKRQRPYQHTAVLVFPPRPPAGPLPAEGEHASDKALFAMARGQWAEAHRCLWEALPEVPCAWHSYHMGLALQHQGRLPEAEACYRAVLAHAPAHPQAAFNLAGLLAETGRWSEAILLYKQVAIQQPEWPDAHFNLGHVYFQLRLYREAQRAWHAAARLQPRAKDVQASLRFLRRLRKASRKPAQSA